MNAKSDRRIEMGYELGEIIARWIVFALLLVCVAAIVVVAMLAL